ncbi:MAG: MutT/nudix family protein, probable [Parcubacteria group bacterium]|nr:MutT/nudix family protein, probable [Parcubacteria group bacterium]
MKDKKEYPKMGIAVMIMKNGKVLLGKRKGAHGAGDYAFPGGKLEMRESFENCAKREVTEETGIEIQNIKFLRLLNFKFYDKHFVDVGLLADWKSGEPTVMEPDKCEGWGWYDVDNLPKPLFKGCASCIEAFKTGQSYFDM